MQPLPFVHLNSAAVMVPWCALRLDGCYGAVIGVHLDSAAAIVPWCAFVVPGCTFRFSGCHGS